MPVIRRGLHRRPRGGSSQLALPWAWPDTGWLFDSAVMRDFARNDTASAGAGVPTKIVSRFGRSLNLDGTDDEVHTVGTPFSGATAATWVLVIRPKTAGSNTGVMWSTNLTFNGAIFIGRDDPAGDIQLWVNTLKLEMASTAMTLDVWHVIICTYQGSTEMEIWLDGTLQASTTTSVPASINSHTNMQFGDSGTDGFNLGADYAAAFGYTRRLTAAQIKHLSIDPFAAITPAARFALGGVLPALVAPTGRIMSSLAYHGGLAGEGGIAGIRGGLAA